MSQNDLSIANADGATVRADLNSALQAIASRNSGATAPTTTYPNQWWFDTTTNILKQRNNANTAWVNTASKSGTNWIPYRNGTQLGTAAERTAGTAAVTDLPDVEDIQNSVAVYAEDAGSTDAYVITLTPAPSAYVTGQVFHFKANTVNTGAATLNVNGLGVRTIVKNFNETLADGDIKAGQRVTVINDGTNFQMLSPVAGVGGEITLGTEQAATGTAIDFTGIAAGTKRIIITFEGVSLSGTDHFLIQIGDAGGIETSGYISTSARLPNGASIVVHSDTTGFIYGIGAAGEFASGHIMLCLSDSANFTWIASHSGKNRAGLAVVGGGDKSLSAELTQVRITRTGANTFDAGAINIQTQ